MALLTTAIRFDLGAFRRVRCALPATWTTTRMVLPEHLFYAVLAGRMHGDIDGEPWDLAAGDACLIPAGTPFRMGAAGERVRLARVRIHGPGPWPAQQWRGCRSLEPVIAVLEERLLADDLNPAEHQALAVLLDGCLERAGGSADDIGLAARLRARIAADPQCTPRDLARELGLSHDYASRVIRRATGLAPRALILRERLQRAADAIATDQPWQHVAADLGWTDPKLFLRQFRAAFGEPPGRWRRRLA